MRYSEAARKLAQLGCQEIPTRRRGSHRRMPLVKRPYMVPGRAPLLRGSHPGPLPHRPAAQPVDAAAVAPARPARRPVHRLQNLTVRQAVGDGGGSLRRGCRCPRRGLPATGALSCASGGRYPARFAPGGVGAFFDVGPVQKGRSPLYSMPCRLLGTQPTTPGDFERFKVLRPERSPISAGNVPLNQ